MTFREFIHMTEQGTVGGPQGGPGASGMLGMNPVGSVNPNEKAASPNHPSPSTMTPGTKNLPNPPASPLSFGIKPNPKPAASPMSSAMKSIPVPPPSPLSPRGWKSSQPTQLQQGKNPIQKPQGK